jgi:hypothetical protein
MVFFALSGGVCMLLVMRKNAAWPLRPSGARRG